MRAGRSGGGRRGGDRTRVTSRLVAAPLVLSVFVWTLVLLFCVFLTRALVPVLLPPFRSVLLLPLLFRRQLVRLLVLLFSIANPFATLAVAVAAVFARAQLAVLFFVVAVRLLASLALPFVCFVLFVSLPFVFRLLPFHSLTMCSAAFV